jgi:UPF0042 nucleotide-binding protein
VSEPLRIVVITGLSGSGKTTAIRVLEDLGFYCIDNLPAVLVPKFLELCQGLGQRVARVALGIDLREGEFFEDVVSVLDQMRSQAHRVEVLFLDAADSVLVRRFSETRRPHPQAEGGSPADGIRREREKLSGLRERADRILDTTALTVHQLRAELARLYAPIASGEGGLAVFVVSFGYKFAIPSDADMVLDLRFLPNPHFVDELRPLTGLDAPVVRFLQDRPETLEFLEHCRSLFRFLLPRYLREGKSYFTLALGCTGGRHRSVMFAEEIARMFLADGYRVRTHHRDVGR